MLKETHQTFDFQHGTEIKVLAFQGGSHGLTVFTPVKPKLKHSFTWY